MLKEFGRDMWDSGDLMIPWARIDIITSISPRGSCKPEDGGEDPRPARIVLEVVKINMQL
jgi:hypothetical protein